MCLHNMQNMFGFVVFYIDLYLYCISYILCILRSERIPLRKNESVMDTCKWPLEPRLKNPSWC